MLRSGNPALKPNTFIPQPYASADQVMTIRGTVNKTIITLLIAVVTASFVWKQFYLGSSVMGYVYGGGIAGFIVALITIFKKIAAPIF